MLAAVEPGSSAIPILLALILAVFGAGFALPASFMLERRLKALRFGARVPAVVVRLAPPPTFSKQIQVVSNVPWVRYRSTDGREHEAMLAPPHPRRIAHHFPSENA